MFPEHVGDHLRTRLDHSLEVAQIARHMARQLRLNEDLVDAISLAHDIGHAPFAHSGERALHAFLRKKELDGYKHNWQSLRIVDRIAESYPECLGLDLTTAVRIGVLRHTGLFYRSRPPGEHCSCDMRTLLDFNPDHDGINLLEAQVVAVSDEIAQAIHDLEDALLSRTFTLSFIMKHRGEWPLINQCLRRIQYRFKKASDDYGDWKKIENLDLSDSRLRNLLISRLRSEIIYQLSADAIQTTRPLLNGWEGRIVGNAGSLIEKVMRFDIHIKESKPFPNIIQLGKMNASFTTLKTELRSLLVNSERVNRMDGKADYIIRRILEIYTERPRQAPQQIFDQYAAEKQIDGKELRYVRDEELAVRTSEKEFVRAAVDYVAGMTDRHALREYDKLYSAYPRVEF